MPFLFEGKPTYWEPTDVWRWDTYTKKKQKKMIAKYSKEPPTLSQFCLCENCKNNYVDNNICKGRHKTKIKHEITNFTSRLFNSENIDDDDIDNHIYEHDIENIENCERIGNEVMKAHLERKK